MELPVYMITGFLESGKTSFILDTISDKQFSKDYSGTESIRSMPGCDS